MKQWVYHLTYRTDYPIMDCLSCPFCYDMLFCTAQSDDGKETIRAQEKKIPDRCPLKFVGEEVKE